MPTYEYRCPDGHRFDLFQRMSDPPQAECPHCGKAAERLLSPGAGLLFKGSGFYITDYRSESYRKAAEAEGGKGGKGGKADGSAGGGKGADSGSGAATKPDKSGSSGGSAPAGPKPESASG